LQFFETIKHFFSGSYHLFRILFSALTGIFIFCFVAFIVIYYGFARDLPDIKTIEDYRPPVISEVFAHDQTKIGEFWTECRFFVPYEKIPRRILLAFLDSEDDRFFEHSGIDMRAILRAFIANLRAKGITQGGSTITQQVTRSLLLSRERSYKRKIKEAILAVRLERSLTKEQILTLYLNQIYLGNRAYGVAAAARNYFHKSLDELTLAEISLIAGLPTAPTSYSPVNNPAAARKRQLHVLGRMLENNHISEEQMQQAMNEPIALFVAGVDKTFTHPSAAYFVEHVRRVVKEQYGDEALYHRGLKIYTTADVSFQEIATKAVRQGVRDLEKRQGYRGPHEHVEKELIPERIQKIETALRREQFDHIIHWPPTTLPREENVLLEEEKQYEAVVTGFEGKNVLFVKEGITFSQEQKKQIEEDKNRLRAYRSKRKAPAIDTKIIISWNALMVSGLVAYGRYCRSEDALTLARKVLDCILEDCYYGGKLLRISGKTDLPGFLEDYSFLIHALLDFYELSFDENYLVKSKEIAKKAIELFYNDGFSERSELHEPLYADVYSAQDNVMPSGVSMMIKALFRLNLIEHSTEYEQMIKYELERNMGLMKKIPVQYPVLLDALAGLQGDFYAVEISGGEKFVQKMHDAILQIPVFNMQIFLGKSEKDEIKICFKQTCSVFGNFDELKKFFEAKVR